MTITFLIISIGLNILFVWYIVQLLKRLLSLSDNIDYFFEKLEEYNEHIGVVYGLDSFHGDTTIRNLLDHSKHIVEETKLIRELYDPDYEEEEVDEELEEN